ncbi:MAG: hypothetical protein U9R58_14700 [Chloroflexota bacterium]|nr:hypothetical protein [Chloroflexota bacterium]
MDCAARGAQSTQTSPNIQPRKDIYRCPEPDVLPDAPLAGLRAGPAGTLAQLDAVHPAGLRAAHPGGEVAVLLAAQDAARRAAHGGEGSEFYLPPPVLAGFKAGIGLVKFVGQLNKILGGPGGGG